MVLNESKKKVCGKIYNKIETSSRYPEVKNEE